MVDAAIFAMIFSGEGALEVTWEVAARCGCYSEDTRQPAWDCTSCAGLGAVFADPVTIRALFRDQSRWTAKKPSGEHGLGEARLTVPVAHKPAYADARIRDRFTLLHAAGDFEAGRVFYPATQPVPFLFASVQYAWRVQLQSVDQATRTRPQP